MKNVFLSSLFILNFLIAACPDGFYEDDCGNCWMPYCYDFVSHNLQYDLEQDECNGQTETWVIPGNEGDPYFNNFCESCPEGFYEDDCDHCWLGFCYTLFQEGLDGDPAHSVYYDLSVEECESYGYGFYTPDSPSNPYWNSNCSEEYDYEIHAGNYYYDPPYLEIEVGSSVMWLNDGGYHNVNGEINTITDEPFDNPESFYIGASAGGEIGAFTFTIPGTYNYDCSIMSHAEEGMIGTIVVLEEQLDPCSDCMASCVLYVMENYGYTEEEATDWCSTTPDSQYGCADSCGYNPSLWDCNSDDECADEEFCAIECFTGGCGNDGSVEAGTIGQFCQPCNECELGSDAVSGDCSACEDGSEPDNCNMCMDSCVSYVMENYGYSEEEATDWCSNTPDSQYGCADSCSDSFVDCDGVEDGSSLVDDCGVCQQAYCYDYVSHEVNFDFPCDGPTEMMVMPDDPSNPYWNSSCEDVGYGLYFQDILNAEDCESYAIEGGYTWDGSFCDADLHNVVPGCYMVGSGVFEWQDNCPDNECSECMNFCVFYVMENYGYTEEEATDWCSTTPDSQYGCADSCTDGEDICGTGDSNQDSGVDVLDVVLVVDFVLGNNTPNDDQLCASDMNADGGIDVLDVVQIVDIILGNRGFKANTAEILINGSDVKFDANGIVDAFQIKLSHNGPIELELTDDALVSKYRTVGNTTTLIIVSPESDYLFTSDNHYIIEEALAATTDGYIDVTMDIPLDYSVGKAYPNPFNPSTNLSIDLNTNARVNISIYNTMGQLMDVIVNDNLSSGYHTYVWDASDAPSGLYLIQTDVNSNISTQKVLLIK